MPLSFEVSQQHTSSALRFAKNLYNFYGSDEAGFLESVTAISEKKLARPSPFRPKTLPKVLGLATIEHGRNAIAHQSYVAHNFAYQALVGTMSILRNTDFETIRNRLEIVHNPKTTRTIAMAAMQMGKNFNPMSLDPQAFYLANEGYVAIADASVLEKLNERYIRRENQQAIEEERTCPYTHAPVFANIVKLAGVVYDTALTNGLYDTPSLASRLLQKPSA